MRDKCRRQMRTNADGRDKCGRRGRMRTGVVKSDLSKQPQSVPASLRVAAPASRIKKPTETSGSGQLAEPRRMTEPR